MFVIQPSPSESVPFTTTTVVDLVIAKSFANGPSSVACASEVTVHRLRIARNIEHAKCINRGDAHSATSPICPKWLKEKAVPDYARNSGVNYHSACSAINRPQETLTKRIIPAFDCSRDPYETGRPHSQETLSGSFCAGRFTYSYKAV